MKRRLFFALIFVLAFLAACQPGSSPTGTAGEEYPAAETPPVNLPADTAAPDNTHSLNPFYTGELAADRDPQFNLWMEPDLVEMVPPANIDCQGEQAVVYGAKDGLRLYNHCIITTGDYMATTVLPDRSIALLDKNTIAQFNFSDAGTEIILLQGGVYNVVAHQPEGSRYLVTYGNSQLEAQGTEFGVIIEDTLTTVVVSAGKVVSYICENWDSQVCSSWNALDEPLVPFGSYSHNVSEEEWQSIALTDQWFYSDEYTNTFLGMAASLSTFYSSMADEADGYFPDDPPGAFEILCSFTGKFIGNLGTNGVNPYMNYSDEDIRSMANERNEAIANFYCQENPDACFIPTATPVMVIDLPPSGGGSSGGSSSSSDTCANVPANLLAQVYQCNCSQTSVYGVFCYASYGEGWFPEDCIRSRGLCK